MKGIDIPIEEARELLQTRLWSTSDYTAFGRAFPNEREDEVIPEVLISGTQNYKDVLLDVNVDGLSFFMVDNDYEMIGNRDAIAKVYWFFAVNLFELYPSVSERAVEYVHHDVLEIINRSRFEVNGITSGFDAFREFGLTGAEKDNMQPFYLCRFDTNIEFSYLEC